MTSFKVATQEALEFLRSQNTGVVATVDEDGQPFASTVYFSTLGNFETYFMTTISTHKAKNLEANPKAAFVAGIGPEHISIMIRGTVSKAESEEESKALFLLKEKMESLNAWNWPIRKLDDLKEQNLVLYKLTPEKVTFLNIDSKEEEVSNSSHLYHLMN